MQTFATGTPTAAERTGAGLNDVFTITGNATDGTLTINGVINGAGGDDVFVLNAGATVASIAFSSDTPTGGVVNLQSIETITLDGGTVEGAIDASAATGTTGVTFNLMSGTVGSTDTPDFCDDCFAITGSGQNDVFILSGDTTDADDDTAGVQAALVINGLVQGGGGGKMRFGWSLAPS